jgi:UDP-3-O-[3-hydroxymyristoyl] glucosamine N-acyltransferase
MVISLSGPPKAVKDISLSDLAKIVDGKIMGNDNPKTRVEGTCSIEKYMENRVSFARNMKFAEMASTQNGAIMLIPQDLAALADMHPRNTYIIVKDVDNSIADVQEFFYKTDGARKDTAIAPTAFVARSAWIGKGVTIGEKAYVGENVRVSDGATLMADCYIADGVVIGKRTCIHPFCTIDNAVIGDDTVIWPGTRVGVDGFRFFPNIEKKTVKKMIHTGNVEIGNRVYIGANDAIQRSTFEGNPTVIGDDVKMGCTIVVGHNNKIGARTIITCHVMLSGSSTIGEDVYMGASSVVSNGVSIGNRAKILINAVVINDVPDDGMVSGFYAMPHREWKRAYRKLQEFGAESQ